MVDVCETLRHPSRRLWDSLHTHHFVLEMANGTLPPRKFAFYVGQNILYLTEFARVHAIGVAKAGDEQTMLEFAKSAASVLEFELPKNRELLERVRALEPGLPETRRMALTNLAYTRHLLTIAYEGGAPEIIASTLPCTLSYGEIGRNLAEGAKLHPVYTEWIRFFAGPEYWSVVEAAKAQAERVCSGLTRRELNRLASIFETSSRLERAFWDMAYEEQSWAS